MDELDRMKTEFLARGGRTTRVADAPAYGADQLQQWATCRAAGGSLPKPRRKVTDRL